MDSFFSFQIGPFLKNLRWSFIFLVMIIAGIGFAMLYSAANGNWMPWAFPQILRFCVGFILMIIVASIDVRLWQHWAYPFYGAALFLLLLVEGIGAIGMGAQRWISLGPISLQPSELMKIALILVLARYFSGLQPEMVKKPYYLILPLLLVIIPTLLMVKQPDLGTALLFVMIGVSIFFLSGVPLRYFIGVGVIIAAALPVAWHFLKQYQKNRILTFLEPERDPLGSGYHILQSKIALGSGGLFGKGYLQGTQSHLNFLPEKQTDFVFTMFTEEFGFIGGCTLIALYILLLGICFKISLTAKSYFSKLVGFGITMTLFIYVFINVAMVMELVPVVGIPLPLVSYGGTALLTLLLSFGLLLGIDLQRYRRV